MIALVDCNNFYASCEKLFDPTITHKPVVVLSNNDGCVIARSAEAKALGIPMGEPYFKVAELIHEHGVVVRSTNFQLYGDLSARVTAILRRYSPDIEVYSIDESFLDLSGQQNLYEIGQMIRQQVQQWTGIPVCVGIASNKTLAKAANNHAKKSGKGVVVVTTDQEREELLKLTAIGDVWGIGRRHSKRLGSYNIKTAHDFTYKVTRSWIQSGMSITGVRTWEELKGYSVIPFENTPPPKQSITTSRSFGHEITTYACLKEALSGFTSSCATKLRDARLVAGELTLFIISNRFREDHEQYSAHIKLKASTPTADSRELIALMLQGLNKIYRPDIGYKKAGVVVSKIVPENEIQGSLFDTIDREKSDRLMKSIDALNNRFGFGALKPGSVGVQKRDWVMKQEHRSQKFTTAWADIMVVRV